MDSSIAQIAVYGNRGITLNTGSAVSATSRANLVSKRGSISQFTKSSSARLKLALMTTEPKVGGDYNLYGYCLTIPGYAEFDDGYFSPGFLADMIKCWKRFCIGITRAYPSVGWIWRIELQERKMPHWHLVAYVPRNINGAVLFGRVHALWLGSLRKWDIDTAKYNEFLREQATINGKVDYYQCCAKNRAECIGAFDYAVHYQVVDCASAIRYLADHQSKHKQSQLGWRGRHWGYINRCALTSMSECDTETIFGRGADVIIRQITRWSSKHYHGHGRKYHKLTGRHCVFGLTSAVMSRLLAAVRDGRICRCSNGLYYPLKPLYSRP